MTKLSAQAQARNHLLILHENDEKAAVHKCIRTLGIRQDVYSYMNTLIPMSMRGVSDFIYSETKLIISFAFHSIFDNVKSLLRTELFISFGPAI